VPFSESNPIPFPQHLQHTSTHLSTHEDFYSFLSYIFRINYLQICRTLTLPLQKQSLHSNYFSLEAAAQEKAVCLCVLSMASSLLRMKSQQQSELISKSKSLMLMAKSTN